MPSPSSALEEMEDVGVNPGDTGPSHEALPATLDAATGRPTASTANNNDGLQIGESHEQYEQHEQHKQNVKSQVAFGSGNSGLQAGVIYGNIQGVSFHYAESQSIFGSLVHGIQPLDTSTINVLARRAEVQAGRTVSTIPPKQRI
jgi:hypothetical protein